MVGESDGGLRGPGGPSHANGPPPDPDVCLVASHSSSSLGATSKGFDKGFPAEVDAGGKSVLDAKPIPSTPSTVCESTYSTVTPATGGSSGLASSVWSQSSGDKTPQTSPPSSTSSTTTELDEGSTQLEPKADDHIHASASITVEDNGNHPEKQGWGRSAVGYTAGTPGSSRSQGCGAKRLREQAPFSPQLHHAQDDSSSGPSPVSDNEMDEKYLPNDLGNPRRKKECLERSQYPRLDGHRTPCAGPISHRNQLSISGMEESIPCVQGDAPRGIFNYGMGSPSSFCGKRRGDESTEHAEMEVAGNVAEESEQALTYLPAQDVTDTCEPQGGSFDQSDGAEMDFDGAEQEPLASGDDRGATSSASEAEQISPHQMSASLVGDGHSRQLRSDELLPAAACGNRGRRADEQSSHKMLVADSKEEEASAFRDVGVTGDEDFKELFAKLRRLDWRWGGAVTSLGDECWICKAGVKMKTATAGVDKFAKKEDVVKYVRRVLGLTDATFDNQDGQSGGERDGDSEGDDGDGDKPDDDEAQGAGEKTATASEQQEPSMSPNGRVLQVALEALNPSSAPGVLQQRTTEFNQVLQFVTSSVARASGGSLYLCGVPGTGKTQTMAHVQAKVQKMYAKGKIPTPTFHAFTGTEFTTPEAMHGALWLAITGEKEVEEGTNIEKKLSAKLKYRQKMPTVTSPMLVVVVDEIDQLMTQNRLVLRKLFEWADAPKSRLVLVGLANSLDFNINLSGLEKPPRRLLFQSYTPEDLASILTERVGATVHHSAIQFCAKKAAATTGDARRAINMCREAVVLAEQELQDKLANASSEEERKQLGQGDGSNLVTVRHMAKAVAAGNASKHAGAIAGLSFYAKVVLAVAVAAVGDASDRGQGGPANGKGVRLTQGDLQEKCMGAWRRLQTGGGPSQVEFTGIIDLLAASGLLALKSKRQTGGRARELVLRIEFADLEGALGDQPFFKTVTEI